MSATRRSVLGLCVAAGLIATSSSVIAQTGGPPIRIGFGMALTGGLAPGGKAALLSYQIWAEDVNARGGLLGRKIELVTYDDQSNPATVPAIYIKLLDVDKVDLLLSGYGTVPTAAVMPIIVQRGKLLLSLFALAVNGQYKYDRYFQIQPNGPNARIEISKGFIELATGLNPRPRTLAITGADAEYSHLALDGIRENAKKAGLQIVYDRSYPPATINFIPIIRGIKSANPDLVFLASYPPDSVALIRAAHEVGLTAKMFGGGTIGLQFAALKTQLGPLLNDVVSYDLYVPEPTMKFPGIERFLERYRERAVAEGVDPLGFYIPPFAYAQLQVLEQAIKAVGSLDEGKLAEHIHKSRFETVVGNLGFAQNGEWAEPRILLVQYQNIVGNELEQFKQPGKQVVLYPPQYKSGEMRTPFGAGRP
ncbi:MAG: amino acid ABC transporter substrate-binding protein [Variibacter sp.]|nr:amino acid ABC transporter substrate-binding protein [Variibacter sp.]